MRLGICSPLPRDQPVLPRPTAQLGQQGGGPGHVQRGARRGGVGGFGGPGECRDLGSGVVTGPLSQDPTYPTVSILESLNPADAWVQARNW